MATYTIELFKVKEYRGTIGLDDYPIFNEEYRGLLNDKIFDHFYNQEIGQETIDVFLHAMRRKMNEIMPMYNQLYESQVLKIDPLNTMNIVNSGKAKTAQKTLNDATSKNESRQDATGQVVSSDFPQTQLQRRKDYASSGTDTVNQAGSQAEGTESSSSDVNGTDETESNTTGWQGSQAMLLMQYRATFLNIDMDIIQDLTELFMFVWNNGDSYHNDNPYRIGY